MKTMSIIILYLSVLNITQFSWISRLVRFSKGFIKYLLCQNGLNTSCLYVNISMYVWKAVFNTKEKWT